MSRKKICFALRFLNLRGLASTKHTSQYDYRPHLQPFNYNLLHDEEGMHVYLLFSIPMKVNFFGVKVGKQRRRQQKGPEKTSTYCHHGLMGQLRFPGNCPPTLTLSRHYHLLLTQGKMLAQGRGRWEVFQKPKLIWVNFIGFQLLTEVSCYPGAGGGVLDRYLGIGEPLRV